MAVPRDPNFWKRFSMAVHQDAEAQVNDQKSETWLITTRRKKRHSYARFCCTFWILLFAIIAIVVVVFLILVKTHTLQKIHINGAGHKVDIDLSAWFQRLFGTGGGDKSEGSEGS
ncbi:hypothetical protein E4T48_03582 [Aureobasidium sp. EXF-10727]|nr:hypothetical protein E4T48_03582 [Aureobasidium sp. EXF-10727]